MKIYPKQSLTVLFILLLFNVFSPISFAKEMAEYWDDTRLGFETLKAILFTKGCTKEENLFLGCVAALNVLATDQTPATNLVTKSLLSPEQEVIQNFDSLSIVKKLSFTEELADIPSTWKQIKQNNFIQQTAFRAEYINKNISDEQFMAVFNFLSNQLANQPHIKSKIADAINAYLSVANDPHTYITPMEYYDDQVDGQDDKFFGIGITYRKVADFIYIVKITKDGPADRAGVKDADIVTELDGVSLGSIPEDEIGSKIVGPENSLLHLTVVRTGKKFSFSIPRAAVEFKNVESRLMLNFGKKIAYIKLGSFQDDNACIKITQALQDMQKDGAEEIIFDLRNNGGGLQDQAICISSIFLGTDKVVLRVKNLESDYTQEYKSISGFSTNLPLAVLINANSASASEIVAGALQDYERAWLVGERSFGKGSAQMPGWFDEKSAAFVDVPPLSVPGGIYLFKTIMRFYQPDGSTNQIVGIVPDFDVPVKPNATEDESFVLREEDLYPNALAAVNAPHAQTRPGDVSKIQSCMQKDDDFNFSDYQLYSAEKVLSCAQDLQK